MYEKETEAAKCSELKSDKFKRCQSYVTSASSDLVGCSSSAYESCATIHLHADAPYDNSCWGSLASAGAGQV